MWGGVGLALDIVLVPGQDDVCALNMQGTGALTPGNSYVCYDPTQQGRFPPTGPSGATVNQAIDISSPNRLDFVNGGFVHGPLTIFASFDYALNYNVLVGARAGYEALTYPGNNPAPAFPPIRLEARVSYLLGARAINRAFAPVFFLGAGAGEFDAFVPVKVTLMNPAGPYTSGGVIKEDAWLTAGPVYATAGGGVRFAFGGEEKSVALTGLLKFEGAFGGTSGFLFGLAPEVGLEFGL